MSPLLPQILWAQRKDRVLLTIDLQDAQQPDIELENKGGAGTITFASSARSHATGPEYHQYKIDLELYGEIDSEESQISITDRRVLLVIAKKDTGDSEYWPRLLKSKDKVSNVKVDWSKWVDEDEEEEKKEDFDLGDLQNMSNFNTGGAGGGLGGMMGGLGGAAAGAAGLDEEDDSDDEDLPELEAAGPSSS